MLQQFSNLICPSTSNHRISKYINTILFIILIFLPFDLILAQCYWQQSADYTIDVDFDHSTHRYKGTQKITYTNHSPDTLTHLFYHLYLNAFQPGSEMDERSRSIADPDPRVGARISALNEKEIGYEKVKSLKMDGKDLTYHTEGTILEVKLSENKIAPGQTVELIMEFEAQVPVQVRRTGRNNKEGIDYSMAQWYPKLCEYDPMGWHSNPYIAREFYGIWGNFDVKINIDSKYIVAASGILQNANEIGHGYADVKIKKRPAKTSWHFIAKNVNDFVWAADPDYTHHHIKTDNGTELHFFYQENEKTKDTWSKLPEIMNKALNWMDKRYGKYPYPSYSFIQGGDGGMEYAMATLITGERSMMSLVGVSVHEWMHSWYQNVLATNEALYPWMDEGFTSFASSETMDYLIGQKLIMGRHDENPLQETIKGYCEFAKSGAAEALSTHSDHYLSNAAYGVGSYTKGQLCLVQLEYIMGKTAFAKALLRYFDDWKFKHPHPNDFFRIMEKEAGMELDWFREYWINSTHVTDYKIDTLIKNELYLSRIGEIPMPLEILVTKKDGKKDMYYIPLVLMRGEKKADASFDQYYALADWPWANKTYKIDLKCPKDKISKIEINPDNRIIDVNPIDNSWQNEE
jgi:hypothetical protein